MKKYKKPFAPKSKTGIPLCSFTPVYANQAVFSAFCGSPFIMRQGALEAEIAQQKEQMAGTERFLKLVDKYTDIWELTPEIVREFIDRIEVHERSEPEKQKNYTQQIDICFNFVGKL